MKAGSSIWKSPGNQGSEADLSAQSGRVRVTRVGSASETKCRAHVPNTASNVPLDRKQATAPAHGNVPVPGATWAHGNATTTVTFWEGRRLAGTETEAGSP